MTIYNLHVLLLVLSFAASITLMMFALPEVIRISHKKKLFDFPDERKVHTHPIPRLGGVTFAPIILLVLLVLCTTEQLFHISDVSLSEICQFMIGISLIFMLGLKDDLGGVHFVIKLFIQLIAALFLMSNNVAIHNLHGLFGIYEISYLTSHIMTVLVVIFITNAMNLIDGADGLASGVSIIAFIFYGVLFYMANRWSYLGFCVITVGVLIPFFYYNFCQTECKIFMGDTGSLTLGYILSFLVIRLLNTPVASDTVLNGYPLFIISILFIPLFDALRVLLARLRLGKNPFSADRNHIHHKILDLGVSKKKMIFFIFAVTFAIVILNTFLLMHINCNIVLAIDIAAAFLMNRWIDIRKKHRS